MLRGRKKKGESAEAGEVKTDRDIEMNAMKRLAGMKQAFNK